MIESETAPRPVLVRPEYAGPRTYPKPPRGAIHVATLCGLVPLIFGVTTFVSRVVTRNGVLALLGLLNILFGVGCTMIGVTALIVQLYRTPGPSLGRFRRFVSDSWIAILLLTINFPLCWLILKAVDLLAPNL